MIDFAGTRAGSFLTGTRKLPVPFAVDLDEL
jgi:hypothetical protein